MTVDPSDANWRRNAACRGYDPNLFIPDGRGEGHLAYGLTRTICAGCTVRQNCLDYALSNNEEFGMWGGLTPLEREELRKELRRNSSAA